jgi:hypothetical protein
MGSRIEVIAGTEKRQVRLGFRTIPDSDRALDAQYGGSAESGKQCRQTVHARRVPTANGTHLDDLPVDQLNPIVLREDAGIQHAVVFVGGEKPLSNFNRHDPVSAR